MNNSIEIYELPHYPKPALIADPNLRNGIAAPKLNGLMEIANGTIFAEQLVIGARAWIHNLTWTATDYNTASWSSGTIQFPDSSSVDIDAGNTGNMSARTFIYFDGTATLKTTTTFSDAADDGKILLAIVDPDADTNGACVISAINSPGTTIDGDNIVTGKIQSRSGDTFFDLNNNIMQLSDGAATTIIDTTGLVSSANFAFGSVTDSNSQTTTSTSFVDVTNMSLNFSLTRAARVLFLTTLTGGLSDAYNTSGVVETIMDLDGSQIGGSIVLPGLTYDTGGGTITKYFVGSGQIISSVNSGSHTVKLRFKTTNGSKTATISANPKFLGYIVLGK